VREMAVGTMCRTTLLAACAVKCRRKEIDRHVGREDRHAQVSVEETGMLAQETGIEDKGIRSPNVDYDTTRVSRLQQEKSPSYVAGWRCLH
jgi:hypothetical protein